MKLGIYGGSFNPIHNGHILVAKTVVKKLHLDKLIIVPVGTPTHRENCLLNGWIRFKMCQLAFKDDDLIEISSIEIETNKKCYTYDTLLELKNKYPNCEYYEIIGEDSAEYFDKWKNFEKILEISKLVVLQRKGFKSKIINKNIIYLENRFFNFSATEIRNRILLGKKIDKMIPPQVEKFIKSNKLYR